MTINERVFHILEEKKLKQSDLANYLGLSTGQITAWKKRGTTPPGEYFINICKFLNISIYELLDAEPDCEIERLYNKCSPKDKATIDLILSEYKEQEQQSSTSMIG